MKKIAIKFIVLTITLSFLSFNFALANTTNLKQQNEESRAKYLEAKEDYLREAREAQEAKRLYQASRIQLKNASSTDAAKQEKTKEQTRERAEKYLENTIDSMIKYLEAMKNKASNVNNIDEADRAEILADINTEITWLQAKKNEIKNATTEQLKQLKQTIQERWKNRIHIRARIQTVLILAARLKYIAAKSEIFASRLETKISELKAAGKDVSQLETLLAEFKTKIASAKEKYQQAKTKVNGISDGDNGTTIIQEAHKLVKEANQYLKQAHQKLTQMTKIIKQLEKKSGNATTTP
ncbi:MAG: hypothetical protein HY764_00465 [Candidatus Portnoybacteria bacterium]|nr:hypothetical protein [Candidatus Portnoybacteria bacterium]